MLERMAQFFVAFYTLPNAPIQFIVLSIGLAIVFGAIWLAGFLPPLLKNWRLWIVFVVSILITTLAISYIQVLLQTLIGQSLAQSLLTILQQIPVILIVGIVASLISGLVQEGAKLVPISLYWHYWRSEITPRFGLVLGAVAGAAYGMIEAFLVHNQIIGMDLSALQSQDALIFIPFLERFFTVGFHTGASALAGYGLAKGKGWQFYLIVSGIHTVYSYSTVLLSAGLLSVIIAEIVIALISLITIGFALWLFWKKPRTTEKPQEKIVQ